MESLNKSMAMADVERIFNEQLLKWPGSREFKDKFFHS